MTASMDTWVLSDSRTGHERQSLALARALGASEPRLWRLAARTPWRWLAPRALPGAAQAFGAEFALALRHPPELAIGCGRQMGLATRLARAAGARAVQILDPHLDPRHWDALVVPEHDATRGPNVVALLGSLHGVDAQSLAAARARFAQLGTLASPRCVLLLGGPIADVRLDPAWWRRSAEALRAMHARDGGSVSICASPRTPAWLRDAARRDLAALPGARWFGAGDGENPYAGMLAWADGIIVSPDSVNMLSEAAATPAALFIADPRIARSRHAVFLHALLRSGRARALGEAALPLATVQPLIELPRVAARVRELLRGGA